MRTGQQRKALCFEAIIIDDNDINNFTTSDRTIKSSGLFSSHLNSRVHCVFKTPKLRPKQDVAIKQILLNDNQAVN